MTNVFKDFDPVRIQTAIRLLQENLGEADIAPLIVVLEELSCDPSSDDLLTRLNEAFAGLGFYQGAALTYAPYLSVMLSDDPFNNPA